MGETAVDRHTPTPGLGAAQWRVVRDDRRVGPWFNAFVAVICSIVLYGC
jgi:hypothetical protein